MTPWLSLVLLAAVVSVATYLRQWVVPAGERPWLAVVLATVMGIGPFLLPDHWLLARTVCAGFAVTLSIKVRMLLDREEVDPSITAHWPRFLLWLLVPPPTHWPRTDFEKTAARRGCRVRFLRASIKLPLFLAIVAGKAFFAHLPLPIVSLLAGLELYLVLSGLADVLSGLIMLGGVQVGESFNAPLLARTPAEFWGRRWNLFIARFARRHLFFPLARRGWTGLGIIAVFVASGLMHEYLVAACLGLSQYQPGFMLAFFLVQAPAVLLTMRRGRRGPQVRPGSPRRAPLPAPAAIALHTVWMVATAPLFFRPLAPLIDAFDATWMHVLATFV